MDTSFSFAKNPTAANTAATPSKTHKAPPEATPKTEITSAAAPRVIIWLTNPSPCRASTFLASFKKVPFRKPAPYNWTSAKPSCSSIDNLLLNMPSIIVPAMNAMATTPKTAAAISAAGPARSVPPPNAAHKAPPFSKPLKANNPDTASVLPNKNVLTRAANFPFPLSAKETAKVPSTARAKISFPTPRNPTIASPAGVRAKKPTNNPIPTATPVPIRPHLNILFHRLGFSAVRFAAPLVGAVIFA